MTSKADPWTLRRRLHNNRITRRTQGSRHQRCLYNISLEVKKQAMQRLTFVLLLDKISHIAWCDFAEKLDVIVGVKLCHLALRGRFRALQ